MRGENITHELNECHRYSMFKEIVTAAVVAILRNLTAAVEPTPDINAMATHHSERITDTLLTAYPSIRTTHLSDKTIRLLSMGAQGELLRSIAQTIPQVYHAAQQAYDDWLAEWKWHIDWMRGYAPLHIY